MEGNATPLQPDASHITVICPECGLRSAVIQYGDRLRWKCPRCAQVATLTPRVTPPPPEPAPRDREADLAFLIRLREEADEYFYGGGDRLEIEAFVEHCYHRAGIEPPREPAATRQSAVSPPAAGPAPGRPVRAV